MALSDITPPTDNLYKFCAISGLLVIGWTMVGLYFLNGRVEDFSRSSSELSLTFIAEIKSLREDEASLAQLSSKAPTFVSSSRQVSEKQAEVNKLNPAVINAAAAVLDANDTYVWAVRYSWSAFLLGFVLFAMGTGCWWLIVQCKEDQLIRLSIRKAAAELLDLEDNFRGRGTQATSERSLLGPSTRKDLERILS